MRQIKIKIILTILLGVYNTIQAYCQFGYTLNGKQITITERVAEDVYIQAKNSNVSSKIINRNIGDGFLIKKSNVAKETDCYVSKIYQTDESDSIMILPRITVFCDDDVLEGILLKYNKVLSVKKHTGNRHRLLVNADRSETVLDLVNQLEKIKGVEWCEPGILGKITFCSDTNPLYKQQYYLKNTRQTGGKLGIDINVEPAWRLVEGSPNITVAVIDQGVELNHEDLSGSVLAGYTVGNPAGFGEPQNDNEDDCKGHGTACAGIIAAKNNNLGIHGIASGAKILPVNIMPNFNVNKHSGFAEYDKIADAIDWAAARADILSCSWHIGSRNGDIEKAILDARKQGRNGKGCIVVFSSGNDYPDTNDVSFPAKLDGVITVGAINKNGNISHYSQRGNSMDLVAPSGDYSGDIVTTDRMGNLGYNTGNYTNIFNGTSAACPQVAGVAALMLSANPQLTESQVRLILQETARDLGTSGWDPTYGYGLVDAANAVARALLFPTCIIGPGIVSNRATYTVSKLLPDTYVTWSQKGNSYTEWDERPILSADQPQANAVTVNNYRHKPFSIILQATIHSNNNLFKPYTLELPITGDGFLSGIYKEVKLDGTQGLSTPLVVVEPGYEYEDCENYASPASDVFVWSNNFVGRNVTYTSPQGSGRCTVRDGMIRFEMPNLNYGEVMTFTVSGGSVSSSYQFRFASSGDSMYGVLSITPSENNEYIISINETENAALKKSEKSILTADGQNIWTLEIYDAMGASKVLHVNVTGNSYTLDTSAMHSGIYVLRATLNGKMYSGKLAVKK